MSFKLISSNHQFFQIAKMGLLNNEVGDFHINHFARLNSRRPDNFIVMQRALHCGRAGCLTTRSV
jgi:hypothetical protein